MKAGQPNAEETVTPKNEDEDVIEIDENGIVHDPKNLLKRLEPASLSVGAQERNDYNEPLGMARQRVAIVERVMKLPYIKATRDTERGQERFVCRDDVITAIHNYAKASALTPPQPQGSDNSAGPGVPPSTKLKERAREWREKNVGPKCIWNNVPIYEQWGEAVLESILAAFASSIQEDFRKAVRELGLMDKMVGEERVWRNERAEKSEQQLAEARAQSLKIAGELAAPMIDEGYQKGMRDAFETFAPWLKHKDSCGFVISVGKCDCGLSERAAAAQKEKS